MFCSISGTTPEDPVISSKTGHLYERSLITKALQETGECPVTKTPMTLEDLLEVKSSKMVKPRATAAASIPGLLSIFHNEWDALMLETHELRVDLHGTRQELSHALYQHDAACRVIARLIKERDSARAGLANAQANISATSAAAPGGMDVEEDGITKEIIKKMTATSGKLSKTRKKRAVPEGSATAEQITGYKNKGSHPIHAASKPGILCVSVDKKDPNKVATGGADGNAMVFNKSSGKVTATLSGHKKKVTSVLVHPEKPMVFTASADKTARVWLESSGEFSTAAQLTCHKDEVTGVTLHATGDYLVTSSMDNTWAFHDISTGTCLVQKKDEELHKGFSSTMFHPDGLILATGTGDARIRIWDIKAQQNVATFDGHEQAVQSISFSENGYYMASGDGVAIKLWDLRKLKNFQTIAVPATSVEFDYSAQFLLAGQGDALGVYSTKTWDVVTTFDKAHGGAVTDVAWSPNGDYITSTAMDRTLKFFQ